MAGDSILKTVNASYSYLGKFPALNGVTVDINKGDRVAVLGANGSGKSTLLFMLAGLIYPDDGTVSFMGEPFVEESFSDAKFRASFRSKVGIVFQNSDVQLFSSSVEDEIMFGLIQLALPEDIAKLRLEKYLGLMDIAHLRLRHPQNLSVGEKKRVAIASVLAMEPEILLLDEPTAGLDPRTCRKLIDTVFELGEQGRTIISSTQDTHIIQEIADRAIVLGEDKRVARDAGICAILEDKAFLEQHNLIHVHAHRHDGKVHVHPHEHPSRHHPHPEQR
jgi:cobalt/nickel transport system ATP-binding protein